MVSIETEYEFKLGISKGNDMDTLVNVFDYEILLKLSMTA